MLSFIIYFQTAILQTIFRGAMIAWRKIEEFDSKNVVAVYQICIIYWFQKCYLKDRKTFKLWKIELAEFLLW